MPRHKVKCFDNLSFITLSVPIAISLFLFSRNENLFIIEVRSDTLHLGPEWIYLELFAGRLIAGFYYIEFGNH